MDHHVKRLRSRRRVHGPIGFGRSTAQQPARHADWFTVPIREVMARFPKGKADPMTVLDAYIDLCNNMHTALEKTVSHKTRQERGDFLRRFFRHLKEKAGFPTVPDPRNLGQRHIQAMVAVWKRERLAPATIQTYMSFLRGLVMWIGKQGMVRPPAFYGLEPADYERHEAASRDKSWEAQGVDVDALLSKVSAFDPHVGASLHLSRAFGLRLKESVMLQPHACVTPFENTGLPPESRCADDYLHVKRGSKGGRPRWIPIDSELRRAALGLAQSIAQGRDAHMGDPERELKKNLWRVHYVMRKFGITRSALGITNHGLRHQVMNEAYERLTGAASPVRGGPVVERVVDLAARQEVAILAGHHRVRSAGAYLGQSVVMRSKDPRQNHPPAKYQRP